MKANWIYATLACAVPLIFAGNSWVVKRLTEPCKNKPGDCRCVVQLATDGFSTWDEEKKPSCSIKLWQSPNKNWWTRELKDCDEIGPDWMGDRSILCDKGKKAILTCKGKPTRGGLEQTKEITVSGGTATKLDCDRDGKTVDATHDGTWINIVGGVDTNKLAQGLSARLLRTLKGWLASDDVPLPYRIRTETELITLVDGDLGLLKSGDTVSVVLNLGQATVEGLCAGTLTTITGPALLTVANDPRQLLLFGGSPVKPEDLLAAPCDVSDLSGKWRGAYSRKQGGNLDASPIILDIRGKSGTVEIPEGTLDIVQFGSTIRAKARLGSGTLTITPTLSKGGMRFVCTEEALGADGRRYSSGLGFAGRVYIAQWALPKAAVNTWYQHQLEGASPAGGDLVWRVSEGKLPDGIALDGASGRLSGTASGTGDFQFTVEVTDQNGDTFKQPLTLGVRKLVLTTTMLPDAIPGERYSFQLQVAGGQPPYNFLSMVPPFLPVMQVSSTGEVTLEPGGTAGSAMFRVRDSSGNSEDLVVTVGTRKLTIPASAYLPPATAGVPYSYTFTTVGASGDVTWSVMQDLEGSGLSFNAKTGELSGTPARSGVFGIDVTARDKSTYQTRVFYLAVNNPDGTAPPAGATSCGACSRAK